MAIAGFASGLAPIDANAQYSVESELQDQKQVFYGTLDRFEKPAEVSLRNIVQATPEFERIQRENIRRGTGEYWILMERASQRALRAISTFGRDTDYDLITASGYLGGVDPSIPATDATEEVVKKMLED